MPAGITSATHSIPLTDRGRAQALAVSESFTSAPAVIITSPYLRAHETAKPTVARFRHVAFETWPIQEFTYLARERCLNTTTTQRAPWALAFWDAADPDYVDGGGAESYRDLIGRVRTLLDRLARLTAPSAAIFSHGTLMKAVHWEIENRGCAVSPATMRAFRAFHLAAPIANAEGFSAYRIGSKWRIEN